jgi:hypothetical protein
VTACLVAPTPPTCKRPDSVWLPLRRRGAPAVLTLLAACLVASGCSSTPGESAPAASATATSPSNEPTIDPTIVVVPALSNIFASGQETAPAPGGGGGGVVPPEVHLPSGLRIVTFPSVTGEVNPIVETVGYNGPGGDMTSDTDVKSFGGISGIIHHSNGMFLVGVFLTDDPPADPPPARLDFTDAEQFRVLEPEIGQTFFIGDGVGRRYRVPPGATWLFLGFVNAYTPGDPLQLSHGRPGYYDNNAGELHVTVDLPIE